MPFCWKVAPCIVAGEGEGSQVKVYSRENNNVLMRLPVIVTYMTSDGTEY